MFLCSGFRLGVRRAMAHALTILHFEHSAPPNSAASMFICLYLGDILLEHLLLFFPVEHHQFRFLLLFNTISIRCSINNHKVPFRSLTNIINRTFTTVIQLPQLSHPPKMPLCWLVLGRRQPADCSVPRLPGRACQLWGQHLPWRVYPCSYCKS